MSSWKRTAVRNIPQYQRDEELENLLVFGYECKLFRDDAKAKYLDQGRHLIPWMGDPSLMIDRYDGRGYLHDLRPYDADNVVNNADDLSEEEKKLEELCDEERYLELHTDIQEKAIYEEEELKRLNEAISDGYAAVAFNYDQTQGQEVQQEQHTVKVDDDEAEPFYAPPELQLPPDVMPPETMKQNAIIEKTAMFISKHSAQMEIVIKTKQKNNPQFAFLEYNNELNPYYKHVVKMIKSAKYQPYSQRERHDSDSQSTGYLHPSLSGSADLPPAKEQTREEFMSSVSSKLPPGQIANTPYAKLLSNLTRHAEVGSPRRSLTVDHTTGDILKSDSSAPYSSQSIYGHHTEFNHCDISDVSAGVHLHPDMLCTNGQPPPPGTVPPGPLPVLDTNSAASQYQQPTQSVHESVVPPPPDMQPVIDKMAVYVAKNGPEFELIVRRKNDARFEFLNAGHVHNAYYEHKKKLYQEEIAASKGEKLNGRKATKNDKESQQNKSISFSLRSKESVEGLSSGLRATALLYESSDEEDEGTENSNTDSKPEEVTSLSNTTTSAEVNQEGQTTESADKKQEEARLKDKLALAAREKLAQASKENQIKAERKRRAAMFINMLKSSQVNPVVTQEIKTNVGQPSTGSDSTKVSPQISRSQSPLPTAKSQNVDIQCSASQTPVHQSHSPSVPPSSRPSKSRSPTPKHRSPSPRRWSPRRRSRSPVRRRKRSRTPPSAYTRLSPLSKHCSHSHVPSRYKHRRSRSRSRTRDRGYGPKVVAPRSRSRSHSRTVARSPSRKSHRSSGPHGKTGSRKRSRSRSRTRKHSRSRKKSRSRSRSRSRKSKSKKKKHSSSRSPKKRRSDDKRSHRKKSSRKHENRASSKDVVMCSSDSEAVVIADDKSEHSELPAGSSEALVIDSDGQISTSSSPPSASQQKCAVEEQHSASAVYIPASNDQRAPDTIENISTNSVVPSDSRDMESPSAAATIDRSLESLQKQHDKVRAEIDMFAE